MFGIWNVNDLICYLWPSGYYSLCLFQHVLRLVEFRYAIHSWPPFPSQPFSHSFICFFPPFLLNHFCLIWLSILLCKKLALHQNKMKDLWVFSCQMCLSLRVIYVYYISQWWPLTSSQDPVLLGPSLLTMIPMFLISPGPPLTFLGSPWQNLIIDHYWY